MEDDLYDEFGNLLVASGSEAESNGSGSDLDDSINEPLDEPLGESLDEPEVENALTVQDAMAAAETIFVDPTAGGADEPVIKPVTEKKLLLEYRTEQDLPQTTYSKDYLVQLQKVPERLRNVAVAGHLHTGKTSLVDILVANTHPGILAVKRKNRGELKPLRYLDTHKLEALRGVSIKSTPATLLLLDLRGRSHAVTLLDCPGHPDFRAELLSLLLAADGVVLVLDVLEGLTAPDKRILTEAMRRNLPVVVVLNKFDRLILELRLPQRDFLQKVHHVLSSINAHVHHNEHVAGYTWERLFSPLKNNVVFASHTLNASFTLASWSKLYAETFAVDQAALEKFLWGDVYFKNGKFTKEKGPRTTFEEFVLDPLYKLITHTLVADSRDRKLAALLWDNFRVSLPKSAYSQDPQSLLKDVFHAVFPSTADLVHLIVQNVPLPQLSSRTLPEGAVVGEIFNVFPSSDYKRFLYVTRIFQGTLSAPEISLVASNGTISKGRVTSMSLPVGRYQIPINEAPPGTIVVLCGDFDASSATIYASTPELLMLPLSKANPAEKSCYKVAVECENPKDLPRLTAALQKVSKPYPSAITKLEDSDEHVVLAPGELYLDCFLHDLRHADDEYLSIKVSDPMVRFAETCAERSVIKIDTETPSKKFLIAITAEPVDDKKLLEALEKGLISTSEPTKATAKNLREFGWDSLAARSLWSCAPSDMLSPSMLLDDSLETDKTALLLAREWINQGFLAAVNEGPLCGEPIRKVKFKILDAKLEGSLQSGGQLLHMTRNAVHTGFLTAAPRLLEPMYRVHATCTYRSISAVYTILEKRRGWGVLENAIPATQLFEIEGFVPVIDSVGLDTDMRLHTQGQAFCSMEFWRWDTVPGDPLDKEAHLPPMKPVPRAYMARDFVVKTRKRKGLSGEPSLQKYIDAELYASLQQGGIIN